MSGLFISTCCHGDSRWTDVWITFRTHYIGLPFYAAALLEQTLKHGQPTELLTDSNTLDLQETQIQHQSEPAQ